MSSFHNFSKYSTILLEGLKRMPNASTITALLNYFSESVIFLNSFRLLMYLMNCCITLLMSLTCEIARFGMWLWSFAIVIRIYRCCSTGFPFEKFEDRVNYKRNHECKY